MESQNTNINEFSEPKEEKELDSEVAHADSELPTEEGGEDLTSEHAPEPVLELVLEPVKAKVSNPKAKWYIMHVAANCENSVQMNIMHKAKEDHLLHMIEEIYIPSYKAFVIQRGKKQEIAKKTMPGYILIKFELNTHTLSMIKSIKKVSNFLGGDKPTPVSQKEIDKIKESALSQQNTVEISLFNIGDAVQINSGPFESFKGNVKEVDNERKKIKVSVFVFGRENLIELDISCVKKEA